MALAAAGGSLSVSWSLWTAFSTSHDVAPRIAVLTILLLVAAVTVTLGGPDDDLDRTGALPWPPRRAAHLLAALIIMVLPLLATLLTGARFGPVGLVVRDAAGLLGLAALSAATIGPARSWFLPLGWTLAAIVFPLSGQAWQEALTWQSQPPGSAAATATASLLAVGGLVGYVVAGPPRCSPAEAAL
ncbi:conserved membrane protein of unknown function [Modestobacter italicus]|uniref:Uncharacterized protein n=1 Tax=Modestobacter italicus (strain DSM 44449 / CECT 9708 / BC 501) TaxID=2732864 RepID=I4F0T7_MODI5|nr:hypothetical protein [Modestobacter marinus]CCH89250.1 conserved membrane protein of unknown function [Modestobacter marinus]